MKTLKEFIEEIQISYLKETKTSKLPRDLRDLAQDVKSSPGDFGSVKGGKFKLFKCLGNGDILDMHSRKVAYKADLDVWDVEVLRGAVIDGDL